MLHRITLLVALLALAPLAAADTYKVDPIHSSVVFKILHNNAANFYGRFNKADGSIEAEEGELKAITAKVEVGAIDTGNKDRDAHLRGPDFFDAAQFPEITFTSTQVKKVEDNKYEVVGDLALHGVTKPITITVTKTGEGTNVQKKVIAGYETTFTIKRSEWGMSGFIDKGVGDEVTLTISLECAKQ